MPTDLGIVCGILILVVTLMSGMPVFVAIGLSGALGSMLFESPQGIFKLGDILFDSIWNVVLLATPGFILMGALFFQHGFGRDLFNSAYAWLGRFRGGLLMSAVWLGAMFGFICGSNMAGVATIGRIAIPEVDRHGYDRSLSLGAFAIAGTLSVLIPPSLLMILYAVLAEVSLGDLFFAGVIPGILLAALLCGYIYLRAALNPALCPPGEKVSWGVKFRSLGGLAPVAITFVVVFGGIYLGVWSVVEASAAGTVMALIFTVLYGRFRWRHFLDAVNSTLRVIVMVYMIVISATLLNYFVFVSKLDERLVGFVTGLDMPGWAVIVAILAIMTVMGCIFDVLALILVSIPVFLPVAVKVGYDPLWFGIILVIACELALVTPPVGINLFIIKDLSPPGTRASEVARGTIPYVGVVWILFALLVIFPGIALWLPHAVK